MRGRRVRYGGREWFDVVGVEGVLWLCAVREILPLCRFGNVFTFWITVSVLLTWRNTQ